MLLNTPMSLLSLQKTLLECHTTECGNDPIPLMKDIVVHMVVGEYTLSCTMWEACTKHSGSFYRAACTSGVYGWPTTFEGQISQRDFHQLLRVFLSYSKLDITGLPELVASQENYPWDADVVRARVLMEASGLSYLKETYPCWEVDDVFRVFEEQAMGSLAAQGVKGSTDLFKNAFDGFGKSKTCEAWSKDLAISAILKQKVELSAELTKNYLQLTQGRKSVRVLNRIKAKV